MRANTVPLLILPLVTILLMTGCSTSSDLREAKGEGRSETYEAPFEVVWSKAKIAVGDLRLMITSVKPEEGYIRAQSTLGTGEMTENVAVFVERIDENRTRVEVVSRKVMATNFFATNWEKPVLDRISELVSKQ